MRLVGVVDALAALKAQGDRPCGSSELDERRNAAAMAPTPASPAGLAQADADALIVARITGKRVGVDMATRILD